SVHYSARFSGPGYHCDGKNIVNGRGEYCLNIGGVQIDAAVAETFLSALAPAGLEASLQAIEQFDADHETTLAQFRRDVERARYNAQRAERRYRAVDPENRLVARGLEAEWESALLELKTAESELSDREHARPRLTRSICGVDWLRLILPARSPASSIAKAVQLPQDCRLRQIVCRAYGRTGRSGASSRNSKCRTASAWRSRKRHALSGSHPLL